MARKVKSNEKFSNVNILGFMGEVVKKHTQHYQSDFEIDKKILAAAAEQQEQQTFIWLCRTHGTWLLHERDVFIKNTREYNTFSFYMEQTNEPILAFVIEVTGAYNNTVYGNLYAVNYEAFYKHVKDSALDEAYIVMKYEYGIRIKNAYAHIDAYPDKEYGEFQSFQSQPSSQEELKDLLCRERLERTRFPERNSSAYIASL